MNIELPSIPAGVMVLLGSFAPFAIALVNAPKWSPSWKRFMSVVVSIALAVIALGGYYVLTGDVPPEWPWLVLLFILVAQTAYALVWKNAASKLEENHGSR